MDEVPGSLPRAEGVAASSRIVNVEKVRGRVGVKRQTFLLRPTTERSKEARSVTAFPGDGERDGFDMGSAERLRNPPGEETRESEEDEDESDGQRHDLGSFPCDSERVDRTGGKFRGCVLVSDIDAFPRDSPKIDRLHFVVDFRATTTHRPRVIFFLNFDVGRETGGKDCETDRTPCEETGMLFSH
jgi:hypothetical protein